MSNSSTLAALLGQAVPSSAMEAEIRLGAQMVGEKSAVTDESLQTAARRVKEDRQSSSQIDAAREGVDWQAEPDAQAQEGGGQVAGATAGGEGRAEADEATSDTEAEDQAPPTRKDSGQDDTADTRSDAAPDDKDPPPSPDDNPDGTGEEGIGEDSGQDDTADTRSDAAAIDTDADDMLGAARPPAQDQALEGVLAEKQDREPDGDEPGTPPPASPPPDPQTGGGILQMLRGALRRPPAPPAAQRPRWRLPVSFRVLLLGGSVVVVLAIGLLALMRDTPTIPGRLPSQPALDATPGGAVQEASPEYRDALATSNDAGTQEALETGASFFPTTEALPERIGAEAEPAPADPLDPAIPVVDTGRPPADDSAIWVLAEETAPGFESLAPIPPASPGAFAPPEIAEAANPMLEQLAALAARPLPRMGSQRFAEPAPPAPAAAAAGLDAGLAGLPPPSQPADSLRLLGLRIGDTARARMMLGLSSDLPGPAIAEITTGPLTGARVSGSFAVNDAAGGLQLQFASISLPDGRELPIQAIGLSPWTGGQVTRSRRDPRYLQRYGGIAAAGAVSGAATAVATPSTRTTIADGAVVVEQSEATRRQVIASALAPAAGAVASDLARRTVAGPLIELDQGAPIVVLFTASAGPQGAAANPAAGLPLPPAAQASLPLLQLLADEALQGAPAGGLAPATLPEGISLPAPGGLSQ